MDAASRRVIPRFFLKGVQTKKTSKHKLHLEHIEYRGKRIEEQKEFDRQHGPVKILWKDGKKVE